ncbi:RNA polymerase sigma factor [Alkalicoccobacillus porphyridii]|uniref:Sigma-70 family RNA polymerase sigma factor n=1 Tax=Alkalicoccobacillus porphyridii TaxID=2597270 RepID=A0A553ZYX1_9BACI|nr:sigma-70 family RNA polymerase sigma factor [Alkalicoccobacillus porphyridii]TSB46632.1 sigma-70 family RNA polymerase sigma factor [Alkalicoccobacillus porphyridii]
MNRLENKLIKRIVRKNDKQAANELVRLYYQSVYTYVYKQTIDKELALDLTQEIFIQMLGSLHTFNVEKASFTTWLHRIATNRSIDYFRSTYHKYEKHRVEVQEQMFTKFEDTALLIERKEEAEALNALIASLDTTSSQIVRLKSFADATFLEVAASLEMKESTVKSKYYAALRVMKKRWEENSN